jgi:alkane 1-monooxygenase
MAHGGGSKGRVRRGCVPVVAGEGGAMRLAARYGLMSAILVFAIGVMALGGAWLWGGFVAAFLCSTLVDEGSGNDDARPPPALAALMDAFLLATLPLLIVLTLVFMTFVGDGDPFGLIALSAALGHDMAAARLATDGFDLLGGALSLGLLYGGAGVTVAHELVHRVNRPRDVEVGRALLGLTLDTTFAIEHVVTHHRYVGTERDPATARRGEYVLAFVVRSTIGQLRSAFAVEAERLRRLGRPVLSFGNRAINGQIYSLAFALAWIYAAGGWGLLMFLALAAQGKFYLEVVNYIEHYGLVRVPGTRVEARHSWNCDRLMSTLMLYKLPRHSHHHRQAMRPYWELEVDHAAPSMPHGYMTMILLAFVPPVWNKIMTPRLAAWDRTASPDERAYLAERGLLTG